MKDGQRCCQFVPIAQNVLPSALGGSGMVLIEAVLLMVGVMGAGLIFGILVTAAGAAALIYLGPRLWPSRSGRSRSHAAEAARLRGRMRRMARPTLLLTPTRPPGFSKLGGEPETPAGAVWPTGAHGPLAFVAQLDLAEVRAAGGPDWLPETGALWVFNDDQRYGFADHVRVLFSPDEERAPLPPPPELKQRHRFGERRVGFLSMTSLPSLDWLGVDPAEANLSDEELDELADAPDVEFGDELQHRIGGYPSEIQDSRMAVECEHLARGLPNDAEPSEAVLRAARSWRLLLQVDSDPALGMNWGDGGRLYVFVREQHARTGKFGKTVSLWQTY